MVIQFCLHPNFLRVVPKPRTEHQRNLRRKRNLFLNTFVTAYKLFIYVLHDVLFPGYFILMQLRNRLILLSFYGQPTRPDFLLPSDMRQNQLAVSLRPDFFSGTGNKEAVAHRKLHFFILLVQGSAAFDTYKTAEGV